MLEYIEKVYNDIQITFSSHSKQIKRKNKITIPHQFD